LLGALHVFAWSSGREFAKGFVDLLAFKQVSAMTGFYALAIISFFLTIPKDGIRHVSKALGWMCLLNSMVTVVQYFYLERDPQLCVGLLNNASMSGCFTAMTFPFLSMREKIFYGPEDFNNWISPDKTIYAISSAIIPALSVVCTGSALSVISFLVVCFAYINVRARAGKNVFPLVISLILVIFVGAIILSSQTSDWHFLDSRGRLSTWQNSMQWWYVNANHWFGTGPGLASPLLPYIQQLNGHQDQTGWFLWFHSDFLQIIFEQGYTGLIVYSLVFLNAFRYAWNSEHLFPALIGLCVTVLANYPARVPIHAFTGTAIIVACFWECHTKHRSIFDAMARINFGKKRVTPGGILRDGIIR
jgi:hypothetical protein